MITNAPTIPGELPGPVVEERPLAAYRGPVLLTSGDQSPPVHTAVVERLATLLPQAHHVVCAGAGHIPHVTHPDEYVHHVLAFLPPGEQAG